MSSEERSLQLVRVIIPLDDNLFRAKKRQLSSPTDDTSSIATILDTRHCKKLAGCAHCRVSVGVLRSLEVTKAAIQGTHCTTKVSVDSKQSDAGFVDDIQSRASSCSEEGFVDEVYRDDFEALETYVENPAYSCIFSRRNSRTYGSFGSKKPGHIARNATFIRL